MKTKKLILLMLIFATGSFTGVRAQSGMNHGQDMKVSKAICILYPTENNKAAGTVTFEQLKEGVKVVVDVHGLTPGKHGFHIHEYGDCSAADATSAGGHFNPTMEPHGGPMADMRHEGDMGNITADESGAAHLEYIDHKMMLEGSNSVIGRGIIVHQGEDDFKTQPTGNSGARVACGVIGVAKN